MAARIGSAPPTWRVAAGLLTLYVLWGSTFLAIRLAVESIQPFSAAGLRWVVAGGLLYLWARPIGGSSWRAWAWSAVLSVFLIVASNGGVTWAETRVPSGLAALAIATVAPWLVILDALRPGGKRPTPLTATGVAVGVLGVASLVDPAAPVDLTAFGVLLVAAFAFGAGTIVIRARPDAGPPIAGTARQMITGGAILLVLGRFAGETAPFAHATPTSWAALIWLAAFGSLAGFTLYAWLVRNAPPAVVGTYACVNPVVALALGAWIAHEALTLRTLLAGGLVVTGVALVTAGRARRSSPRQSKVDWSPGLAYPDRT